MALLLPWSPPGEGLHRPPLPSRPSWELGSKSRADACLSDRFRCLQAVSRRMTKIARIRNKFSRRLFGDPIFARERVRPSQRKVALSKRFSCRHPERVPAPQQIPASWSTGARKPASHAAWRDQGNANRRALDGAESRLCEESAKFPSRKRDRACRSPFLDGSRNRCVCPRIPGEEKARQGLHLSKPSRGATRCEVRRCRQVYPAPRVSGQPPAPG
jgi:hypothetical protein